MRSSWKWTSMGCPWRAAAAASQAPAAARRQRSRVRWSVLSVLRSWRRCMVGAASGACTPIAFTCMHSSRAPVPRCLPFAAAGLQLGRRRRGIAELSPGAQVTWRDHPHPPARAVAAGDFIDEDTQQVLSAGPAGPTAGGDSLAAAGGSVRGGGEPGGGAALPAVTNASWRMVKWMRDYVRLMR